MRKKISVITHVYNEEETVEEVYRQIKKVFADLKKYDYEHLFTDNASADRTVEILKKIAAKDKRVKILVYSKNFGPMPNIMTAHRYASGDAVIAYEANLKDPPNLIKTFIKHWEKGFDVIYGERKRTQDSWWLALMRKSFYRIINLLSKEELPLDAGEFRLIDRKVVDELIKLDDYKPYLRGLITSIGFKQIGVKYNRRIRPRGKGKGHFWHLVDYALNAFISYSIAPIRICTYIGLGLSFLSFLGTLIYLVLKIFFWPPQIPAVSGLVILILMFFGIQLFFLGIIGEYIGAIHSQVRKKPFVIIKEKINFDN